MSRFGAVCGVAVGLLLCAVAADNAGEQPKEIPLDQIWAYAIPGTRDVRDLEPIVAQGNLGDDEVVRRSLVQQILLSLSRPPQEGRLAGPIFAVAGTGKEALKNAHEILTSKGKKEQQRWFSPDMELSLVFYSYSCGRYVQIVSVEESNKLIMIRYRFVTHFTTENTTHFALIPIGKRPIGTTQVKVIQLPPINENGEQSTPMYRPRRIVCDGSSFGIDK